MMKISDEGSWPFAGLGTLAETGLGDWVLTLAIRVVTILNGQWWFVWVASSS
jgi:hypothetical protein